MAKEISSDAQGVLDQYSGQDQQSIIGAHSEGDRITSGEVQRIIDAGKYSTISSDVAVGDTTAPEGGLQGIYDTIAGEAGLDDLQSAVSAAKGDLKESQQAGRAQQQALRDRPESINLIRGRQQQASLIQNQEELALAEAANLSIDEYNMAKQEALFKYGIAAQEYNTIQNVMLNNPQAGIKIGDSMATVTSKLGAEQERLIKQQQDREDFVYDRAQKDSLKNLANSLGISTKGKSTKKLREKIADVNQDALDQQDQLFTIQLQQQQMALDKSLQSLTATQNTIFQPTEMAQYYNTTPIENVSVDSNTMIDNLFNTMGYGQPWQGVPYKL